MKNLVKIAIVVLTLSSISCEKETIENSDQDFGIEQGVDRAEVERPGTQGED